VEYSTKKQSPRKRVMLQTALVLMLILFAIFMYLVVTKEFSLTDGFRFFLGTTLLVFLGGLWICNSKPPEQGKDSKWTPKNSVIMLILFFVILGLFKIGIMMISPRG
jgi:peptidoglycan/LPS O-acetylase OafA/YrhL